MRHQVDLIDNKVNLQEKHYEELQGRDTDAITRKKEDIEKAQQGKRDYMLRINSLNNEIETNKLKLIPNKCIPSIRIKNGNLLIVARFFEFCKYFPKKTF